MRIFLVLICSLALASFALGAQEGKKKEKKGAQAGQASQPGGKPAGAGKSTGAGKPTGAGKSGIVALFCRSELSFPQPQPNGES